MTQVTHFPRTVRRLVLALFCAFVGVGLLGGGVALAHNSATESSPADGEVLQTAPTQWTMTFAKSVPLSTASGQLVSANGVRTDLVAPRHGNTENVIVFDLPATISGNVTARWRLVGTDGHVISGRVAFSVQAASIAPATNVPVTTDPVGSSSTMLDSTSTLAPADTTLSTNSPALTNQSESDETPVPDLVRTITRFWTYFVLTLFGGLFFAEWYIAQGTLFTSRGRQLANATTLGLIVLPIITLWILVNDLRGPIGSFFDGLSSAASLTIGQMIMLRIALGAIIAMLTRSFIAKGRTTDRDLSQLLAVVVMYCITLSYGGHSRSQRFPIIGIPADVIHVLAVSAWLGGLALLLAVVIPAVTSEQAITAFIRFGQAAERAVPLIIVTGLIQSFRLHQNVGSLFTSDHGMLLLAKIGVVLGILSLGNRNRKVLRNRKSFIGPRAGISRAQIVQRSIYELIFGAVAIGITSVLVAVTPT